MAAAEPRKTSKANDLVLYRLDQVEAKVDGINRKLDTRDNITKADLDEFRTFILQRFQEQLAPVQKELDRLDKEKADAKEVSDIRTLIKAVAAFFTTILAAIIVYYLTTGRK